MVAGTNTLTWSSLKKSIFSELEFWSVLFKEGFEEGVWQIIDWCDDYCFNYLWNRIVRLLFYNISCYKKLVNCTWQ